MHMCTYGCSHLDVEGLAQKLTLTLTLALTLTLTLTLTLPLPLPLPLPQPLTLTLTWTWKASRSLVGMPGSSRMASRCLSPAAIRPEPGRTWVGLWGGWG